MLARCYAFAYINQPEVPVQTTETHTAIVTLTRQELLDLLRGHSEMFDAIASEQDAEVFLSGTLGSMSVEVSVTTSSQGAFNE